MKKMFIILFLLLTVTQAQNINECKVDLYYATDIILPEDEDHSAEVWKIQSKELLKKYPQLEERIGERKVAYNISEGVISDLLVKTKENAVAGITWTAFKIWAAVYIKSKATKFMIAQADAASLMIHNRTLEKQIESYNESIESGHSVVVVAHSIGNLFTEGVFREFEEKGEGWKQDYFHTIAIASTQSDIINGGHGVTFDNDIVYLKNILQANETVKISNPNRHDWGYKNNLNEHVIHEDFWSSEYHKFEYYMGYPVMETTRITENFNTVESKVRQTNIAKDMIIQWMYDEIIAHETRDSQWITDEETDKDSKDYRITVKHKFDSTNMTMSELEVYPFNTSKKLYSVNGEYVKASCGGKNITESDDSWMIDNPEEEKIGVRFERNATTNIVTDHKTNLMWQDEADTWLDSWYGAGRHCTALTLGDYNDWRIPTYDELIHILDLDGKNTYRYDIFEHLGPVGYWSSTLNGEVSPDTQSAKVVNFGLATWIWINTSQHMNTRCVRTK